MHTNFDDLIQDAKLESDVISPNGKWRIQIWSKLQEVLYPFDLMDKAERWLLIKRMDRIDGICCVKIYTQQITIGNWSRDPHLSDYIERF